METLTAKELKNNLDFTQDIDGVSTYIAAGHELFESNFQSWVDNHVSEEWENDHVIMTDENGDPWKMTREEYKKL